MAGVRRHRDGRMQIPTRTHPARNSSTDDTSPIGLRVGGRRRVGRAHGSKALGHGRGLTHLIGTTALHPRTLAPQFSALGRHHPAQHVGLLDPRNRLCHDNPHISISGRRGVEALAELWHQPRSLVGQQLLDAGKLG